jgi:hypothetical protein
MFSWLINHWMINSTFNKISPIFNFIGKEKEGPSKKGCVLDSLEVKRGDGTPFLLKSILYNYNNYFDKIPVQKTSIQETFQLL